MPQLGENRSDAEIGRNMARISNAERLARAVILFHHGGEWTANDAMVWHALTGSDQATSKVLCDLARQVRGEEEKAAPHGLPKESDHG